jgi:aspartate/methionine/tyrosine aminotransferase
MTRAFGAIEFCHEFIALFRERVKSASETAVPILEEFEITVITANNDFFLTIILTDVNGSSQKHITLSHRLIDEYKVNVRPAGHRFNYLIWGWFRLYFSCPDCERREGLH